MTNNIWEDDLFGRAEIGALITRVLLSNSESRVISIGGGFGHGKTFFAERLFQQLRADRYPCFFVNAWRDDLYDAPIVSILSAIKQSTAGLAVESAAKLTSAASKLGSRLMRFGSRLGTSAASVAALGTDVVAAIADSRTGSLESVESLLKEQAHQRETIQTFKSEMREWLDSYADLEHSVAKRAFIFIDELDRCRPDFALRFLEDVKHLFDVDGFTFLLFVDADQLNRTASTLYGVRETGERYIDKFIDWSFRLPEVKPAQFAQMAMSEISQLNNLILSSFPLHEAASVLGEISQAMALSARRLKSILTDIRYSVALYGDKIHDFPAFCIFSAAAALGISAIACIENVVGAGRFRPGSEGGRRIDKDKALYIVSLSLSKTEGELYRMRTTTNDTATVERCVAASSRRRQLDALTSALKLGHEIKDMDSYFAALISKTRSIQASSETEAVDTGPEEPDAVDRGLVR